MNDIPPPKPKKPQGLKRKKDLQEDLKKAKRATRLALKKQEDKIVKAKDLTNNIELLEAKTSTIKVQTI